MKEKEIESQIRKIFSLYRGMILDVFEQELGDSKNWKYVRSRLLKILSCERGLERRIVEIVGGAR